MNYAAPPTVVICNCTFHLNYKYGVENLLAQIYLMTYLQTKINK
jgi:hypothetical protein